jgi:hypothetical protein
MLSLVATLVACQGGAQPRQQAPPPAATEHVQVLRATGSGMGVGMADEIVRHNLPMLETCALEAALPPHACARVRFQIELPRHGGRFGYVAEETPAVDTFTSCLTRGLQTFRFPSPGTQVPGSTIDATVVVVASPAERVSCAERMTERAPTR